MIGASADSRITQVAQELAPGLREVPVSATATFSDGTVLSIFLQGLHLKGL